MNHEMEQAQVIRRQANVKLKKVWEKGKDANLFTQKVLTDWTDLSLFGSSLEGVAVIVILAKA